MDKQSSNLRNRILDLFLSKIDKISKYDAAILELYQRYLYLKNANSNFDLKKAKDDFYAYILNFPIEERFVNLIRSNSYIWGLRPKNTKSTAILDNIYQNKEIYFIECTFLNSIIGIGNVPEEEKFFKNTCGYILDDLTLYYDATKPSRMEIILNSDFELSKEQLKRARNNIDKLIKNKISKYNNQPIFEPKVGRRNVPKVLVVDQSYKDYSIIKGSADETTFEYMLKCAIDENPDADILIKTHPDAIGDNSLKPKCYYQNVKTQDNIYRITEPINPISILQYVDKVYVCSSQLGFEALMCKKEVHTFGIPFYAGWGLTIDNQNCQRRTRKRTLEDIFYIAYILMSLYINPETNSPCEIEDAIDYLIKYRQKYFEIYQGRG